MTGEPERMEANERKASKASALLRMLADLLRMLRHNLLWKLLALFLAVCLWAGLITQDPTLTRERVFGDVPLTVTGADTLKRNGLIVTTDLSAAQNTVRLRVDVPQREYNTVVGANYAPRIDLSRIREVGEQTLKISATSTTAYGSVKEITPDEVNIMVEEYITRYRIPVTVVRSGSYPEGYYGAQPTLDPPNVTVSGPRSIVEQVARAVVAFDVSKLPARNGLVRTGAAFTLIDAAGETIDSGLVEVTSESVLLTAIIVEQTLFPMRTIAVSDLALATGTPAEGYEVKSVSMTPREIRAAGAQTALDTLDALFLEHPVSLKDRQESFLEVVSLRKPAEIVYMNADSVTVAVEIGPRIESRAFRNVRLTAAGVPSDRSVSLGQNKLTVTVTGPALWVAGLKAAAVTPFVDVTGLPEGEHSLPVLLALTDSSGEQCEYTTDPLFVTVTLKAK